MKNRLKMLSIASALALSAFAAEPTYTTEPYENLRVWADPITLIADGTTITKMFVCQSSDVNYSAFNMAFIVPEGIKIAQVKQGRKTVDDIHLTERGNDHDISCGQPDPTTIKVISWSMSLAEYYPDDEEGNPLDELFYIGLTASDDMEAGEYQVQILDIKFVMESADAHILPQEPLYTTFTVVKPSTGITEVCVEEAENDGTWHDLLGRQVRGNLSPGIYVRNGHKVAVK